jgi:hypothetical protein
VKRNIDPAYAKTTNQIVFNVAIPAMLFSEICQCLSGHISVSLRCCAFLQPWE